MSESPIAAVIDPSVISVRLVVFSGLRRHKLETHPHCTLVLGLLTIQGIDSSIIGWPQRPQGSRKIHFTGYDRRYQLQVLALRTQSWARASMSVPFWSPSAEDIRTADVTRFREFVNERHGIHLRDFWELHRWSTGTATEMNDFWNAVWCVSIFYMTKAYHWYNDAKKGLDGCYRREGPGACKQAFPGIKRADVETINSFHSFSMHRIKCTRPRKQWRMPALIGQRICCSLTAWRSLRLKLSFAVLRRIQKNLKRRSLEVRS